MNAVHTAILQSVSARECQSTPVVCTHGHTTKELT